MINTVTLTEAARELNKSESTLRRWIRKGCPAIRLGETGRDGSLVRIDDIKQWRAGVSINADHDLEIVAEALLDTLKRDCVHERAVISERQAAIVLLLAFQRYFRNTKHRQPEKEDVLPETIEHLCTFAVR